MDSRLVGTLLSFYGLSAGFLLTLYALFTKDSELRQSRRELFRVLLLVLLAFVLQCLLWLWVNVTAPTCPFVWWLWATIPLVLYGIGVWYFFVHVVIMSHTRSQMFKDPPFPKLFRHTAAWRYIRHSWLRLGRPYRYETTSEPRKPQDSYKHLLEAIGPGFQLTKGVGLSLMIAYESGHEWLSYVAGLVKEHIQNGETVTYVACRWHPARVIAALEQACGDDRGTLRKMVVVVDAFTPSFGGEDEVFYEFLAQKKEDGYRIVPGRSLPGIHTAAGTAFHFFKCESGGGRHPATVIYDGLLAFRHQEADQQISRFLMHVVEAERTYEMITIFGEPTGIADNPSYVVLTSMADYCRKMNITPGKRTFSLLAP